MTLEMNFQFHFQGTPLEKNEAMALLSATRGNDPVSMDIAKLVDVKKINSKFLFDLAVKEQKAELANLAWKICVAKGETIDTGSKKNTSYVRITEIKEQDSDLSIDDIIDKILNSKAYWSAGAALILGTAKDTEWTTLRQLAVGFVQHCNNFSLVEDDSVLYKGFKKVAGKGYEPSDYNKNAERSQCFHVSPLYIGLREGLIFCQKQGLVETKSSVSSGFSTGQPSSARVPGALSRIFYKLRLSDKGATIQEKWSDAEDHAISVFKERKR